MSSFNQACSLNRSQLLTLREQGQYIVSTRINHNAYRLTLASVEVSMTPIRSNICYHLIFYFKYYFYFFLNYITRALLRMKYVLGLRGKKFSPTGNFIPEVFQQIILSRKYKKKSNFSLIIMSVNFERQLTKYTELAVYMSFTLFLLRYIFFSKVLNLSLKKDKVKDTQTSGTNLHIDKNNINHKWTIYLIYLIN